MAEFDIVLKGGMVFDGARHPRYLADVAIKDGIIAQIGRIDGSRATRVIDAQGLHVAPGFVDLHTHYDSQLFWDPYCSISGWHGVTSVVIGNCGFGFAPVRPEEQDRAMLAMSRNEAVPLASMKAGMPWDWESFPEFLDSIERTPKSVNILPYVPLSSLLIYVMGLEDAKAGRMPTDAEHKEMRRLLNEAMDAGGCGFSFQRVRTRNVQRDYDGTLLPTDVMHDETLFELAEVLGQRNQGFIQGIQRSADPEIDRRFFEKLATITGRPVLWNSLVAKEGFPEIHRGHLAWLRGCLEKGLRIYAQLITTNAGATFTLEDWNIWDDSATWREALTGTVAEKLGKVSDPARRQGLRDDAPAGIETRGIRDVHVIEVRTPENRIYEGMKIGEIASREGRNPIDVLIDIAIADELQTVFYVDQTEANHAHRKELVDFEYGIPGVSDGGAHTKFVTQGRFPTEFLTEVVRDMAWCSLEEAHWRLSAWPAFCAGFTDRGVIKEGAPADIVVYDYKNLGSEPMEIAFDYPANEWRRIQKARGYRYVLVNGQVTIEDDKLTDVPSGALLRNGVASRRLAPSAS